MANQPDIPEWLEKFPPADVQYWLDKAHSTQEKVHLYAVTLAFTVLGLSIQTAKVDGIWLAQSFELLGWLLLLMSGLFGLFRMIQIPKIHKLMSNERLVRSHSIAAVRLQMLRGQSDEASRGKVFEDAIKRTDEILGQVTLIQNKLTNYFRVHLIALALGLCSLVISRGCEPVSKLWNQLF